VPTGVSDPQALDYLRQTVQEAMRLYPAAPVLFSRRTREATRLGPWQFPARTLFMVPVRLLQVDERWFPEPERPSGPSASNWRSRRAPRRPVPGST